MSYHGHPFADAMVSLVDTMCPDAAASHSGHAHAVVDITVVAGPFCVFVPPVFPETLSVLPRVIDRDVYMKKDSVFDLRLVDKTVQRLSSRPYIEQVRHGPPRIVGQHGTAHTQTALRGDGDTMRVRVPLLLSGSQGVGLEGALGVQNTVRNTRDVGLHGHLRSSLVNVWRRGETVDVTFRGRDSLLELTAQAFYPWIAGSRFFATLHGGLTIEQDMYARQHIGAELLHELRLYWKSGLGVQLRTVHVTPQGAAPDTGDFVMPGQGDVTAGDSAQEDAAISRRYVGSEVILTKQSPRFQAGASRLRLHARAGAGVSREITRERPSYFWKGSLYGMTRWQVPFGTRWAYRNAEVINAIIAPDDTLLLPEKIGAGGIGSIRGYPQQARVFQSLTYMQHEVCYYFSTHGCVYLFGDAGAGSFTSAYPLEDYELMLGYGAGLRMPSRLGLATLEWARNKDDTRGWGRIHLSFHNQFSLSGTNATDLQL
jgi:hypothetical protein